MKRCPQCQRVETDDALVFCRADGTALISDSGSVSADAGTVKFGSAPVASEVATSVLPQHTTDAGVIRPTGSTTVLDRQQTIGRTRDLARSKRISTTVGANLLSARQYDQAIEQFKKTIEMDPNFPAAHAQIARAYERKGK